MRSCKRWLPAFLSLVREQVFQGVKTAALGADLTSVKCNTETLIEELRPLVSQDRDGSLKAIGVDPSQAEAFLERLGELTSLRQPEQGAELEQIHRR